MPLLNKEPFVRKKLNSKLPNDSEVFFCNATNEAFTDYDEFFERSILCSSMVWTCSVTGRSGLTFQEAAASELEAITMISSFSPGLQRSLLYLIKTVASSKFNDIAYSVWAFATQRYFVDEEVEVVSNNGSLIEARIVRVLPPNLESLTEEQSINIAYGIDPSLYRYEIVPTKKGKLNFRMIVPADKVSRTPFLTKDKVKLFLKQHVICKKRLKMTELKESSVRKYNLNGICWNDIFAGPLPDYDCSEVTMPKRKVQDNQHGRDRRKQTLPGSSSNHSSSSNMAKGKPGPKPMSPEAKRQKIEEQKRQRAEAKRVERAKLREEKEKRDHLINLWKKKRDEYECDDLCPILIPMCPISQGDNGLSPVVSKIPSSDFGDALMVLEYFNNFEEFFDLKEIFPHGFTFDLLEKSLVNNTIDSPIGDLIRITLQTIFCLQDDEDKNDVASNAAASQEMKNVNKMDIDGDNNEDDDGNNDDDNGGHNRQEDDISVAQMKAKSSLIQLKSLHGQTLTSLTINAYSITEVLRQHLLISGTPKPRSIYRGWFSSYEDAGLSLKLSHPDLINSLEKSTIYDLNCSERLLILKTLMEQVSSFPAFREIVDAASDNLCEIRKEMRTIQAEFSKWEKDHMVKRSYGGVGNKKPETVAADGNKDGSSSQTLEEQEAEEIEKFKVEREKKLSELNKQLEQLRIKMRKQDAQHSVRPLGRDRAFRRYWILNSINGLFIEMNEENVGCCIEGGTPQTSSSSADDDNHKMSMVNGHSPTMSDKENQDSRSKKSSTSSSTTKEDKNSKSNLDVCTGSVDTCAVHGINRVTNDGSWSFVTSVDGLKTLINSLNQRGIRESELRESLEKDFDIISESINKCPCPKLNQNIPEEEVTRKSARLTTYKPGTKLSYSTDLPIIATIKTFADQLIQLEEQLFSSGFSFRNPIVTITRDEWRKLVTDAAKDVEKELLETKDVKQEEEPKEEESSTKKLSKLLSQLTQSILPNNLVLPLGTETGSLTKFIESLDTDINGPSQLFLFLDTLDTSISWSKSALTAYCRICRKKKGADQMLLCDGCNRGYHTYCLNPPLESVPIGEWYCSECKPKKTKVVTTPRKVPRTEPINYNEDETDDEENGDEDDEENEEDNSSDTVKVVRTSKDAKDDSDFSLTDDEEEVSTRQTSAASSVNGDTKDLCVICNETETDLECTTCYKKFHLKCHGSTNQRSSRNSWTCSGCASTSTVRPPLPKLKLLNPKNPAPLPAKVTRSSRSSSAEEPAKDDGSRSKRKRSAPKHDSDAFLWDEKSMATAVTKGQLPPTRGKDGQPCKKKVNGVAVNGNHRETRNSRNR